MTTTIWRPKVRIDVPDVGDVDDKDTLREDLTKKGTKRKYAPRIRQKLQETNNLLEEYKKYYEETGKDQ